MASFSNSSLSFVKRAAATVGVVTITLAGYNTMLKVVGNTRGGQFAGGSGSVLQVWSSSGAAAAKMNSSGTLILSGATIVGHKKTGTGKIVVQGSQGGSTCWKNRDGVGCVCLKVNHAAPLYYSGSTADCSPQDSL